MTPWKTHLSLVVNINSRDEDADIDSDYLSGDVDPEVHVEKVKDHQLLLQQFSYKNISDLTDQELSSFFRVKEKIYDERRKRVQEYCDTQGGFQKEKKMEFPMRAGSLTHSPYGQFFFLFPFETFPQPADFSREVYTLLFDPEDGVSMCPVAKIASSTWIGHFADIGRTHLKITY